MKQFIKDLGPFKKKISLGSHFQVNYRNVVNLLFNLLIDTHLRVGNEKYAESNKTYESNAKLNNQCFTLY
jgi:DNA topoisomerase IB